MLDCKFIPMLSCTAVDNASIQITVFDFQSMKSPVELNSHFLKFFCYIWSGLLKWDTRGLKNETFTSGSIVSSKQ